MNKPFERLQENPQTGIQRSALSPDERSRLRQLSVSGHGRGGSQFTTVYYLAGDEKAAAEVFAEKNADAINDLDLSGRNPLQESINRNLYDLVLDAAGLRERTIYQTVVREDRPDGTTWILDREVYDTADRRRYTIRTGRARAGPGISLERIFKYATGQLTETDLRETDIEGDIRQVLDYYRAADEYRCHPVTIDDELAVRKVAADSDNYADSDADSSR